MTLHGWHTQSTFAAHLCELGIIRGFPPQIHVGVTALGRLQARWWIFAILGHTRLEIKTTAFLGFA